MYYYKNEEKPFYIFSNINGKKVLIAEFENLFELLCSYRGNPEHLAQGRADQQKTKYIPFCGSSYDYYSCSYTTPRYGFIVDYNNNEMDLDVLAFWCKDLTVDYWEWWYTYRAKRRKHTGRRHRDKYIRYRHPKTIQERTVNTMEDHKPYIRAKRRKLPSSWDEPIYQGNNCWKEHRKKQYRVKK